MVQQVKHFIMITPSGGDATTSVVLNNARFEDEPTDVDIHGNPLYMKATNTGSEGAILGEEIDEFEKAYFPPDPKPLIVTDLDDRYYDLDDNKNAVGHIYAKDVITLSEKDIIGGENNGSYLDNEYMPNRIHRFYKDVFGHKSDHFMIGTADSITRTNKKVRFVYDTMHEAFVKLRETKKYLLTNYEECINFVYRDVCSADAFFHGILGVSSKNKKYDNEGKFDGYEYTKKINNFNQEDIRESYFGISTKDWESNTKVDGLKHPDSEPKNSEHKGKMMNAGEFSSIKEHMPLTAFIQERREAVETYLKKVQERTEGVQFANVERYKST